MGWEPIDLAVGETVQAAVIFPAAEEATAMRSGGARGATTDPVLAKAAAVARPAWGAAAAGAAVVEAEVGAAGADAVDEHPNYSTGKPTGSWQ